MFERIKAKNFACSKNAILAVMTTTIFLLVCIFGEGLGGSLGSNPTCFKYLGCTTGFLGYDAIEHFLFGIAAIFLLLWCFEKFPKYSMLHTERWKNVLTIIALIIFTSVLWELAECAHDAFRIDVLGQTLVNWKLHLNLMDQPTNLDTIGDLTFTFLGSAVTLLFSFFPII
jgi:hypothetical protein